MSEDDEYILVYAITLSSSNNCFLRWPGLSNDSRVTGVCCSKEKQREMLQWILLHTQQRIQNVLCVETGNLDDNNDSRNNDNDSRSSSHWSVSLFLMKGPHDDGLAWLLRWNLEIKLFNQVSDTTHHSEIVNFDDEMPTGATYRVMDDDGATEGYVDRAIDREAIGAFYPGSHSVVGPKGQVNCIQWFHYTLKRLQLSKTDC